MKCLVKTGHDPSRRERCDRWRYALPTTREIIPSRQSIIPFPTGRASEWDIPAPKAFGAGYPQVVPPGQKLRFSTVRLDSYDSVAESLWQPRADIS